MSAPPATNPTGFDVPIFTFNDEPSRTTDEEPEEPEETDE